MAYDVKAYNEWERANPKATDADKEAVKAMYQLPAGAAKSESTPAPTPAAPAPK